MQIGSVSPADAHGSVMLRYGTLVISSFACLAMLMPVRAQEADLRGGFGVVLPAPGAEPEEGVDAVDGAGETAGLAVGGLRGVDAGEEVEALATVDRQRPIQPFAERVRAVQRRTPAGNRAVLDDTVYAGDTLRDQPSGIRLGSFLLYPELAVGIGWTDNRANDANGTPGPSYIVAPTLRLESNWSRHSLGVNFRGSYIGYGDDAVDDDPNITTDALLQLDLSERTQVDLDARYGLSLEDRGSAESSGTGQDVHEFGTGVALRRSLGLIGAVLSGRVDSTHYTGRDGSASEGNRDNALFTAALRIDGQTGARFQPFVEGSGFKRRYFEQCSDPTQCADRNSVGYGLRAGFTFNGGSKWSGDLSAGWRAEHLDDPRLKVLQGLTVDGSLIWSPTRLTTVTALLGTNFAPSTISGTPGSVIYSTDLRIAHGFSDALSGEVGVGYSLRDYTGIMLKEKEARATTALTWAFTSKVALQARYTFRRFISTTPGSGYSSNAIEAGLRFRH
ncbi:outer membrane beta-barrel protein [Stappia taiwanensis]|uniref:Outer membrane beta-barrel protein n=1 Tax=Stappia taiwanensis TaxID=992267 RepID=A0A838XV39_9HYPH|nr:outer membrane beta-barrel protein [Stappia taiwanensis]